MTTPTGSGPAERPGPPGVRRITYPMIDAYGDGGFRFDGVRAEGSQLIVSGVITPWPVTDLTALGLEHLDGVFNADPRPELILLGCGARMARPPEPVAIACRKALVGLEFMDTPAACRVYATLVGEGRHIAAALIAV